MAALGRRLFPTLGRVSGLGQQGRAAPFGWARFNSNLVSVERREDKIAVVRMHRKPVNALDYDMLTALKNTFEEVEEDRGIKAVILASDNPGIFSAGLDILEMYQATDESARRFWTALQDMWFSLYTCGKPTVAAINGASPAGGCLLACSCDYRVMAESAKYTIGLNETRLSISAPFWFVDLYVSVVGQRVAERALQLGTLFPPTEALKIGLVDEVVPSEQVMEAAVAECQRHMQIPAAARRLTKRLVRERISDTFEENRDNDVELFATFVLQDAVQAGLEKYLQALKAKSGAK